MESTHMNTNEFRFVCKATGKLVIARPSPAHGEYRIYDAKDNGYLWNASHVMLRNMEGVELPEVKRG
jgi:hypothetical protein